MPILGIELPAATRTTGGRMLGDFEHSSQFFDGGAPYLCLVESIFHQTAHTGLLGRQPDVFFGRALAAQIANASIGHEDLEHTQSTLAGNPMTHEAALAGHMA